MMSTKWTFSFLTLMLVGLLIAAPVALANKITLRVYDANRDGPGAGADAPADISAEDGIQVLADPSSDENSHVMIRLDAAEPLVAADVLPDAFEIVGATFTVSDPVTDTEVMASEGNKRFVIMLVNGDDEAAHDKEVTVFLVPGKLTSATTGDKDSSGATLKFKYMRADPSVNEGGVDPAPTVMPPKVVSMTRATAIGSTIASAFLEEKVSGEFLVKIVLTEKPNGGLHSTKLADRIAALSVSAGKATNVVIGAAIDRVPNRADDDDFSEVITSLPYQEGGYTINTAPNADGGVPNPTGRDDKHYTYLATIMPDGSKDEVVIQVKDFKDLVSTQGEGTDIVEPGEYEMPTVKAAVENRTKLTVKVVKPTTIAKPGETVAIPNDTIIPAGGYLVVVRDDGDGANEAEKSSESLVIHPGDRTEATLAGSGRSLVKQSYNVVPADLKYNLEGFLIRGGTIDLIAPDAGVKISEIMWATDGGETNRQWIEIHNTGSTQLKTKDYKLMLYIANETPDDAPTAPLKIQDRVSTLYKGTNHWSIAGKGQSGRTEGLIERRIGGGEDVDIAIAVVPTDRLISMERVMDTAGMYADGTMASSWAASVSPSSNFGDAAGALFVGSPGASPINPVADPVPVPEPGPAPVIPVAMKDDIMITEIMVDTGGGRLPQWIELTNISSAEKSLAGWSLMIANSAADADAVGASVSINLRGTLGVGGGTDAGGTMGKSLLLVAGTARSSSNLAGSDRVVDISSQVKQKGRYTLLSTMGFMITLLPPQTTGIVQYGDMAGNLDAKEAWELPMDDAGRSSLIRREMLDDGMATMGTDANGWVLASSTALVSGAVTWYGSDEDAGTPGYDAGGPLPVELSHFRPARDKQTGAVVITWATQSELNNAGFFIKRSQQRDGQFKVINAAMIAGAGTTSEKQFYTYTDTTAQPNVVYYYQIEDVSLDGNRQTLTRGMRLKGHVSVAGKATLTWGELKTSQ